MNCLKLDLSHIELFHYTNNGKYKYVLLEFNLMLYLKDDLTEPSKFVKEIQKFTKMKPQPTVLYIKGNVDELRAYQIGQGVEAFVANNSPFSVLKILKVSPKLMKERNLVPTSVPCSLRAIVENGDSIYYIYHQIKVNTVPQEDLLFSFKRLDIIMMKYGFFQVLGYSDDSIRVYTDGFSVIDDVGIGNIGYGLDNRIHIVDCSVHDVGEWEETNDFKIPNKIACLTYNSDTVFPLKIDEHLKSIEFDINNEIKSRELILDVVLSNKGIEINYPHI